MRPEEHLQLFIKIDGILGFLTRAGNTPGLRGASHLPLNTLITNNCQMASVENLGGRSHCQGLGEGSIRLQLPLESAERWPWKSLWESWGEIKYKLRYHHVGAPTRIPEGTSRDRARGGLSLKQITPTVTSLGHVCVCVGLRELHSRGKKHAWNNKVIPHNSQCFLKSEII